MCSFEFHVVAHYASTPQQYLWINIHVVMLSSTWFNKKRLLCVFLYIIDIFMTCVPNISCTMNKKPIFAIRIYTSQHSNSNSSGNIRISPWNINFNWIRLVVILVITWFQTDNTFKMSKNFNQYGKLCTDEYCSFQPWKAHTHRNQ